MRPVVLDLDGSVGPLPSEVRVPLRERCDTLRFACSDRALRRLQEVIDATPGIACGPVFLGSGDFHHLSLALLRRIDEPIDVVVLDNHPDNMRYPFGVHCGSWVRHAALLPHVRHVHVVGITSADVSGAQAWQNCLAPLRQGRLTYWCIDARVRWAAWIGLGERVRSFDSSAAMLEAFTRAIGGASRSTYVSIDKDVFSTDVVRTNWDQGRLTQADAREIIGRLAGRVVGSDVTGEVSVALYAKRWKRLLAALDHQPVVRPADLTQWRDAQHRLNESLLPLLMKAYR